MLHGISQCFKQETERQTICICDPDVRGKIFGIIGGTNFEERLRNI